MKINLNLLRSLIDFPGDGRALADLLETVGFEIDRIEETPAGTTLEFDITPNRPDWLCHLGVAREVAAKLPGLALKLPALPELPQARLEPSFPVRIDDSTGCLRYCGALIAGVRVADSPQEVACLLESLGLRPINNLVDISNLVMMTLGQPMHFFDAGKLAGPEVRVRRARTAEKLVLLDGRVLPLEETDLVIADRDRPVALAGIMGGLDSGITEATRTLFIESAHFAPRVIRRTARRLGLRTDASYRYERGTDPALPRLSLAYSLALLERFNGEKPVLSFFSDAGQAAPAKPAIELAKEFPARFSGMTLSADDCEDALRRLGFAIEDRGTCWQATPPSYRVDVAGKEDLVEEITRIQGYDHLPSVLPTAMAIPAAETPQRTARERARDHLALGAWFEAQNWAFVSPEENILFFEAGSDVVLKNPLGREYSVLRNSLLPGLLRNVALNLNAGENRLALFEIGRVFRQQDGEIIETERLALVAAGLENRGNWRVPAIETDLFSLKTALLGLGKRLRWKMTFAPSSRVGFVPGRCLSVVLTRGDRSVQAGWLGEVDPQALGRHGIERAVFASELDLALLSEPAAEPVFVNWNRLPLATRDFSFLLPAGVTWGDFSSRLEMARPAELETVGLVDLYRGKNVPAGTVSMTVAFAYRAEGRTLSGEEITALHTRLTERLTADLGLMPRTIQGVKS